MSATDFRQMIELRDNQYVAIENSDGIHVVVDFTGVRAPFDRYSTLRLINLLRDRMAKHLESGFDTFEFGIRDHIKVDINYYDAGVILDALKAALDAGSANHDV